MTESALTRRQLAGLAVGVGAVAATACATPAAGYIANPELPWFDVRAEWGGPGAVGNGEADDTAAIIRAVAAAAAAPYGGTVFVPTGSFKITGPIQFPVDKMVSLAGTGKWYSRFYCASATAGLRFADLGGENASAMPMVSGIWVDGASKATTAMNFGRGSNRRVTDVQISDAGTGLLVEQAQNMVFDDMLVAGCMAGIVLDYGAGGNTFFMVQSRNNGINVVFRNSWDGSGSMIYSGRPSDNKFISCLIEGGGTDPFTTLQVDHMCGIDNRFISMGFSGTGPKIRMRHQQTDGGPDGHWGSYHLHLVSCGFVNGSGIEHTANGSTIYMTDTKFFQLTPAFTLGNACFVEIDSYRSVSVDTRFAHAPGATDAEETLIRRTASHPHNITTPAASNVAYRAGVDGATNPSYQVKTSGETAWGPGGATAPDVRVRRPAANRLLVERADGVATTQPTLLVQGGLGVGNSANATSLGTVVKKIQVFDAAGNPLGYVPVYDSIT